MEKKIYKYSVDIIGEQVITLPKGSEILTIQTQIDEPKMWVLVDPKETEKEEVVLETLGTGENIPDTENGTERKYLASYQIRGGGLVFHVFQKVSLKNK